MLLLLLAQSALFTVSGSEPGELLGSEVGIVGDLDGDGVPEVLAARGGETPGAARPELLVLSGADGTRLFDLFGAGPINELFLQAVLDLGEVDGDGVPDFAFGNSTARVGGTPNRGRVTVFSGRSGARLHFTEGPVSSGAFGGALARLGDLDGDGVADLVVGQIGTQDENAWLVSGASGALLDHVAGPRGGDPEFGWSVAATGDLDGDGLPDFAVGTLRKGLVTIHSGTGRRLRTFQGSHSFGRQLADLGDLDGDGFRELAIGETGRHTVWIASPRSGALVPLDVRDGVQGLASAGDLDGDGRNDLLVGDAFAEGEAGVVRAFSSRDGRVLARLVGAHPGDHLGARVAGGADFDGDGVPDAVLGAPRSTGQARGVQAGSAALWSLLLPARCAAGR